MAVNPPWTMVDAVRLQTSTEIVFEADGQRFNTMPPVEPQPTTVRGSAVKLQCGAIEVVRPVMVAVDGVLSVPVRP